MIHPEHTGNGTGTASQAQISNLKSQISNAPGASGQKQETEPRTKKRPCTRTLESHPRTTPFPIPTPTPTPTPTPSNHTYPLSKKPSKKPLSKPSKLETRNARSPERDDLARGLARLDVGREGRTVGQLRARERRVVVDVADLCVCMSSIVFFSRAHWGVSVSVSKGQCQRQ